MRFYETMFVVKPTLTQEIKSLKRLIFTKLQSSTMAEKSAQL